MGLNSEYNKDKWGFVAMGQGEGVGGGNVLKGGIKGRGDSC